MSPRTCSHLVASGVPSSKRNMPSYGPFCTTVLHPPDPNLPGRCCSSAAGSCFADPPRTHLTAIAPVSWKLAWSCSGPRTGQRSEPWSELSATFPTQANKRPGFEKCPLLLERGKKSRFGPKLSKRSQACTPRIRTPSSRSTHRPRTHPLLKSPSSSQSSSNSFSVNRPPGHGRRTLVRLRLSDRRRQPVLGHHRVNRHRLHP